MTDQNRVNERDRQLKNLAREIKASERVVVITGAGVSVASGIAPFRKSPDAVWEQNLTERGTLRYFLDHPSEAWAWYDQRFSDLTDKEPNSAHEALVQIERWCISEEIEMTLITQNVDRLHLKAGSENVIEIHGRSDRARCTSHHCDLGSSKGSIDRRKLSFDLFKLKPTDENLPCCPQCQSLVRPHVLWFDETYDSHQDYQYTKAVHALENADLIIAIGTSFSVGITELALYCAELYGSMIWGIDLGEDLEVGVDEWVIGKAEEIIPLLRDHLSNE